MKYDPASDRSAPTPSRSILVLGPHRSGTSALTRVLNLLGVDLGGEMLPPKFDNQLGYWEHREVFELHERLLSRAGSAWHEYRPLPPDWLEIDDVKTSRRTLADLLDREFRGKAVWGVKDPRLCKLLPLWREVLEELPAEPCCVILVRNPLEVASSLERRNQFSHSKSVLLYLADMLGAVVSTEGLPRAFVSYSRLLTDWRQTVEELARHLRIEWPVAPSIREEEIDSFLKPSERHHHFDKEQLRNDPTLPPWGVALYEELERASRGDDENVTRRAQEADEGFRSARALFLPELDRLQAENLRLVAAQTRELGDRQSASERADQEHRAERSRLRREAELARLEHRAEVTTLERRVELAENELNKVQRHLTSILSSPLYRSTRSLRRAWRGLTRLDR